MAQKWTNEQLESLQSMIERMKDETARAEEFLIMPYIPEYVIVGNLELDACFQLTSGTLSGRFAYNFAGQGLRAYFFGGSAQAEKIIIEERLYDRYEAIQVMDRKEYIRGFVERQKEHIEFYEATLKGAN